jgi:hypothetical protein
MIHELIDLRGRPESQRVSPRTAPVEDLRPGLSAREVADALIEAAGRAEIEHSRAW